jgi:hypothetical protein
VTTEDATPRTRRELRARGHSPGNTLPFQHLASPQSGKPLCDPANILVTGGLHDRISPLTDLEKLTESWSGSKLLRVPQGHFGYRALRETMTQIEPMIIG